MHRDETRRPRQLKRLGQVFLADANAIDRFIADLEPAAEDIALEVGAGDGRLSVLVAPLVRKLFVNELDERFVRVLNERLAGFDNVEVIHGDILSPATLEAAGVGHPSRRLLVFGAVPYYISSPLLRLVATSPRIVARAALLLQLEVARRAVAGPSTKEYGFLSVLLQRRAEMRLGAKVGRRSFRPIPKVDSQVLHLEPRSVRDEEREERFAKLISAVFGRRRKQLRGSLRAAGFDMDADIERELEGRGVSLLSRPENLSPEQFELLLNVLEERLPGRGECSPG